ncbi:MAG: PAS domain S-box protein [Rhodocyclaceae bacterium]|nr:PAS domain S-box protein [Rhodocyclaceae bacterium]
MKPGAVVAIIRRLGVNFGFLVFMLVFVAGIGASTGYTVYRLRAEAIATHAEIAAMHARAVEDYLTQSFNIVNQTLANVGYAGDDAPARMQIGRRFEAALLTSPALRSVSLLDAGNRIVASSNPGNLGIVVDDRDYLPPHADNSEFARIGRPWSGRDFGDGSPPGANPPAAARELGFIPVLRSIHVGARTFTLAAAVNPDYFINYYGSRLRPAEGFVEVLRYDGANLLSTDERYADDIRHKAFFGRLAEVDFGSFEETLRDGTPVITAFRASRLFPLVVLTHIRRSHALGAWAGESRRLLLTALPALLAVVVLTTLLYVHLRRIEEQQAEARQRDRDRLAATVFQTVAGGVMVADADHRIIAVNPAFTAITGYAEEEVIGRKWQVLAAEREPAAFFAALAATLAASGGWHGEIWHRHKNGVRYVAWQSINQVRNEEGKLTYLVAAFSDITDRKQAEEAQLRAVIEASPEAVLLVNGEGRIAFANRVAERLFGYTLAEATGLDVGNLVPLPQRTRHAQFVREFNRHPHSRPMASGMQLMALRRDGAEFPAEISLSPMKMGDRFVVIAAISDVSQRLRDEQALRASEERWKFALEGAGEGVWDWNIASAATSFSKRILDFWGCAESEVAGRLEEWTTRIHADDLAFVMAELQSCLDGKREAYAVEHRARCKDGRWHWALVRGMVVSRDGEGKPLRMIGTYADVTGRKTVEHELMAAKEAAEALLQRAGMAERHIVDISERTQERIGQELHDDLGQHLTGAAFLSEILFRKLDAVERDEKEDAANITRLINAAVAKTRTLAQGLYPVALKEAGLQSMLEQLARNVETMYEIECEVRAAAAFAIADPGIAINLFRMTQEAISNAIRHGKATKISVSLLRTTGATVLEIADNGCGLGQAASQPDQGGLGMHTMRYRAALIGATLEIAAGADGGARVVIALPPAEETDADALQRAT